MGFDIAIFHQNPLGNLGNIRIEGRHHLIEGFDNRDFAAQRRVHIGKFQTDVAATNNRNPRRQTFELNRIVARKHGLAIDFDTGRHKGKRTGRKNHVFGGEGFFARRRFDRNFLGFEDTAKAFNHVNAHPRHAVAHA